MSSPPMNVSDGFRSGFVCLVGRPNTGKSTLTNALVGTKVAITSNRPQTTRRIIRGVVTRPQGQLVLVDTPGVHRPRTLLGQRLNDTVQHTVADADVLALCLPANEQVGPGDRRIVATEFQPAVLPSGRTKQPKPAVVIVTKSDTVKPAALTQQLVTAAELVPHAQVIPVSASTNFQLAPLTDLLISLLPPGPLLFSAEDVGGDRNEVMIAELVREAALENLREELPHSLAVQVDEVELRPDRPVDAPMSDVRVVLYVERSSQKGVIIGAGGSRLRQIGMTVRPAIQELLGHQVYLDLHVKVAPDWQRNPKYLDRLGL